MASELFDVLLTTSTKSKKNNHKQTRQRASAVLIAICEATGSYHYDSRPCLHLCQELFSKYEKTIQSKNLLQQSYYELVENVQKVKYKEAINIAKSTHSHDFSNQLVTHCIINGITRGSQQVLDETMCFLKQTAPTKSSSDSDSGDGSDSDKYATATLELAALNTRIEFYNYLISKYPSIQFVTTFYRYLPHIYGKILLATKTMSKLMINDDEESDILVMSPLYQQVMCSIYDSYAGFTKLIQVDEWCMLERIYQSISVSDDDDITTNVMNDNANDDENSTNENDTKIGNDEVMNGKGGKNIENVEMSIEDLQHYIISRGSGDSEASIEHCQRICQMNNENEHNIQTLTKIGFLTFYADAAIDRPAQVLYDIQEQGQIVRFIENFESCVDINPRLYYDYNARGYTILNNNYNDTNNIKNIDNNNSNYDNKIDSGTYGDVDDCDNYNLDHDIMGNLQQFIELESSESTRIYQLKKDFIDQIEERFVINEWMLIDGIIKESKMDKIFSKLNNDIKNMIFKHLHPLEIVLDDKIHNVDCNDQATYDIACKIRNFHVLNTSKQMDKTPRFGNRFFYDLMFNRLKQIGKYNTNQIKLSLNDWLKVPITLNRFCYLAKSGDIDRNPNLSPPIKIH